MLESKMTSTEINKKKLLSDKSKEELISIIYRKDKREQELIQQNKYLRKTINAFKHKISDNIISTTK